ncbi:MAG: SHOCT domain-containing protein [Candidatus Kuenenia stuttgartiensis]|nr:SHOCT domain-containing protein [Candidatus Kuenenia stuttgartiensis]
MMNGHYWGMGWGMWFIPLLIILIVYLLFKNNSQSKDQETPLEILKRRYAKGEITKEEYEQMKSDLSK